MALISFVVPVYQVQGYLRQCLDSIFGQSSTDFEVIAVDDCSPDSSGEILAEYVAREPRLRVITLDRNEGQGPARNHGLAAATGEYVWFVDSDDWLAEGAVRAVADRLRETGAEMLIVDHAKVRWNHRVARSGSAAAGNRLSRAPQVFVLREWPEAIEILHVPWNKIVRRELLLRLDFRFRPGWYEDIPFTYGLLLAAERISTLDRVCIYYRLRRIGAATRTAGVGHFAIFSNWAQVFDLLDVAGPEAAPLRPLLFRRMVKHLLQVRGNGVRVPKELGRSFFAQMTMHYQRYLPPEGYPLPGGMEGVKHRLVAAGRYRSFQLLRAASRGLARLRRTIRRVRRRLTRSARNAAQLARNTTFRVYYLIQLRQPIDPSLAVYAAYWYRGYACNPAAIYEKARELAPGIRGVWVVRRDRREAIPAGVDHVVAGSLRYHRVLARARWLINNVNWPGRVVKRPGAVHVMTHHGTPVKVMGLDQQA
ncbi:MAG TPA: glycosyltransferase, partial [Micromonospora sp.]|nr:glycosyltransferase [Micromonospora sp.]